MRAPCAFWERLPQASSKRQANGRNEGSPSGGGLTGPAIPPLGLRLLP